MGLDNIKYMIIGVIVCIAVVTGGIMTLNSFHNASPSLDTTGEIGNFSATMNKANEINATVSSISGSFSGNETVGLKGWLDALVGKTYGGLKVIGQSTSFINTMATDSANSFGIPTAIITILLLCIPVIIGFAIWSAITKT